jgi:hypothetical protein
MTWMVWRQFRTQVAVVGGVLVLLAIALALTGPNLVHYYDTVVAHCSAHGDCTSAIMTLESSDARLQQITILLPIGSALIGIFWGAPLVARELETGTHRLAWTQSATRMRWLAVKVGVVGLASVAVLGLLSLMITWWFSPIDRVNQNLYGNFDQRGIVAIGYAAFAFALGVTLGVLIRRTLPAMATTLVAFVAIRFAFTEWVRPHLVTPLVLSQPLKAGSIGFGSMNGGTLTLLAGPPNVVNAWVLSTSIVNRSGSGISPATVARVCPTLGQGLQNAPGPGSVSVSGSGGLPGAAVHGSTGRVPAGAQSALSSCIDKLSATYHQVTSYQPSSHYWPLQGLETASFVVLALILFGVSAWWVRRRLS